MTRTEACALLGVSPKTLYLWERDGKIPRPRRDRRGWRFYTRGDIETIRRRLGPADAARAPRQRPKGPDPLAGLSARNQLRGTVVSVRGDRVLCEVTLRLGDGQEITAVITRPSAVRLGLRPGRPAIAVIKSTEVMLFG